MPVISDSSEVVGRALSFLNLGVNYSIQYGDQLPISRGKGEKSTLQQFSPEAYVTVAERLTLSYTPTFNWYTSDSLNDTVNHAFSARAGMMIGENNLSLSQSYYLTEDPLFETGRQTRQETIGTTVALARPIAEKVTVDAYLSRQTRDTDLFNDVESWSGFVWLRRAQQQGFDLAAGIGGSYYIIEPGPDSYSRQTLGKIRRQIGDRVDIQAEAGLDVSSFSGNSRKNISNAIYGLDARYRLFEPTTIFIGARRTMMPAYYSDQLVLTTRYSVGLDQRLLGRLFLRLGISHPESTYISSGPSTGGENRGRKDNYWGYSARLGTQLFQRLSVALMWQYNENKSNLAGFTYRGTNVGLTLGVKF